MSWVEMAYSKGWQLLEWGNGCSHSQWLHVDVADSEPICVDNGVTEVGHLCSSSLPSYFPALKTVGWSIFCSNFPHHQFLNLRPWAPVASVLTPKSMCLPEGQSITILKKTYSSGGKVLNFSVDHLPFVILLPLEWLSLWSSNGSEVLSKSSDDRAPADTNHMRWETVRGVLYSSCHYDGTLLGRMKINHRHTIGTI